MPHHLQKCRTVSAVAFPGCLCAFAWLIRGLLIALWLMHPLKTLPPGAVSAFEIFGLVYAMFDFNLTTPNDLERIFLSNA
jgi:hypothetical protein